METGPFAKARTEGGGVGNRLSDIIIDFFIGVSFLGYGVWMILGVCPDESN